MTASCFAPEKHSIFAYHKSEEYYKSPVVLYPTETVDLMNPKALLTFKSWNGELRYLTNFKLRRFKKQSLEDGSAKMEDATVSAVEEMDSMEVTDESEEEDEITDDN